MKIAITSTGPTLEHFAGTRAGNCRYLLIIDPDTMDYEVMQNPIVALRGPAAGKLFLQMLIQNDVHIVLAKSCGSDTLKVFEVLRKAGILIRVGLAGSIRSVVEQFKHSYCSALS